MRKIKMILAAALLAVGTTASAQFVNTKSESPNKGRNTVYLQWNPSKFTSVFSDDSEEKSFTGFSVGYNRAFSVTQSAPVFVEAGVGLQYSYQTKEIGEEYSDYDTDDFSIKQKFSMLSVKVPVSLMYEWQIPNCEIAIMPYAGIDFRFNVLGKMKYDISGETVYGNVQTFIDNGHFEDVDLFDSEDVERVDAQKLRRFQAGWHVGVNFRFFNQFLVGVSYGEDFSKINSYHDKDNKIHTTSITLGYCF